MAALRNPMVSRSLSTTRVQCAFSLYWIFCQPTNTITARQAHSSRLHGHHGADTIVVHRVFTDIYASCVYTSKHFVMACFQTMSFPINSNYPSTVTSAVILRILRLKIISFNSKEDQRRRHSYEAEGNARGSEGLPTE